MDSVIILPQLSFTRSGYYEYSNGSLGGQSSRGCYWSRPPNGKSNAYSLDFRSAYFYLRNNFGPSYGLSLRCLVALPTRAGSEKSFRLASPILYWY